MNIKFSYRYSKLLLDNGRPVKRALLVNVLSVDISKMPIDFIEYDTDCGKYHFPSKGNFLLLLFLKLDCLITPAMHLFSTLRPWSVEKLMYYKANVGDVFDIEIEGE